MKDQTRKLIRYTLPSILSMVSIFLFSIVDGIFVGHGVGINAVGAINISFPFIMFFESVVMLTTIGGLTVTAIRVGRKDFEGANQVFRLVLVLNTAISFFLFLAGTLLSGPIARLLGATDTFYPLVKEYIFWYSIFMIPCFLNGTLLGFARNDGIPELVSIFTISASVLNIIGDYILIFPMHMGIKGAAIATGLSQSISFLCVSCHFLFRRGKLYLGSFHFDPKLTFTMIKRGMPECVAHFGTPITMVLTNIMLARHLGDNALNAYALLMYIATFSASIFIGASQGLQPLFGNSYGEGNEGDLRYYLHSGIKVCLGGGIIINSILFFLGPSICMLFNANDSAIALFNQHMPKYLVSILLEAVTVTISAFLYSTTRSKAALTIHMLRAFVADTIVILSIPVVLGPQNLWFAPLIIETIVMTAAIILLKYNTRDGLIGADKE